MNKEKDKIVELKHNPKGLFFLSLFLIIFVFVALFFMALNYAEIGY